MLIVSFIDPQQTQQTDAIVKILSADFNESKSSRLDTAGGYINATHVENINTHLSYQAIYWTSKEKMDAGAAPYALINQKAQNEGMPIEDNNWFRENNLHADYQGLTPIKAAEKHLLDVVFAQGNN